MNAKKTLGIIYDALRQHAKIGEGFGLIEEVALESDDEQLILTTDDGQQLQVWVLSAGSLVETDSTAVDDSTLHNPAAIKRRLLR